MYHDPRSLADNSSMTSADGVCLLSSVTDPSNLGPKDIGHRTLPMEDNGPILTWSDTKPTNQIAEPSLPCLLYFLYLFIFFLSFCLSIFRSFFYFLATSLLYLKLSCLLILVFSIAPYSTLLFYLCAFPPQSLCHIFLSCRCTSWSWSNISHLMSSWNPIKFTTEILSRPQNLFFRWHQ